MGSFSGASEDALQNLIDQHKGAAKKKLSLPTSIKEIRTMMIVDMKVSRMDVQACTEKKELVDLYVKQLSLKEMKELLNVSMNLVWSSQCKCE